MEPFNKQDWVIIEALFPEKQTVASLGRIYQHWKNSGANSFAMLTSWKTPENWLDLSDEQQNNLNRQNRNTFAKFKDEVRSLGLGFHALEGRYPIDKAGKIIIEEPSLFIPEITRDQTVMLGKKYNQTSVVYCGPDTEGKVVEIKGDTEKDLGVFHPKIIDNIYSLIHGRPFTFAALELKSNSLISAMVARSLHKQILEGKLEKHYIEATAAKIAAIEKEFD